MTDKNITDNEITIKALKEILEVMLREGDLQRTSTISHTIDLINRQKAEIEKLNQINFDLCNAGGRLLHKTEKVKAEAIKEFAENVQGEIRDAINSSYLAKEERVAKYKKLGISVNLEDDFLSYCNGKIRALRGIGDYIDNLVKEKVGET